jgi:DNA invertase Pin-like site-specific DNA recombinase
MKPVFYARVSRDDLHCENQKATLLEWARRNDITEEEFNNNYFWEELTTRKSRPIKENIIIRMRKKDYDTLIVSRIDRFARSLIELTMNVEEIINNGGRFVAIHNGFDFDKKSYNASQQLILNIFSSFAQFEREIIRERTLEGLKRVKAQGKKLGRPRIPDHLRKVKSTSKIRGRPKKIIPQITPSLEVNEDLVIEDKTKENVRLNGGF